AIAEVAAHIRSGRVDSRAYHIESESFYGIPGTPFAYSVGDAARSAFKALAGVGEEATVASGTGTLNDFRFLRLWWECNGSFGKKWFPFAKGGSYSPTYFDHPLVVGWETDGAEMKSW